MHENEAQNESSKNPLAVALGRLGRGVKKTLTDSERNRRRNQMTKYHAERRQEKERAERAIEEQKRFIQSEAEEGRFVAVVVVNGESV